MLLRFRVRQIARKSHSILSSADGDVAYLNSNTLTHSTGTKALTIEDQIQYLFVPSSHITNTTLYIATWWFNCIGCVHCWYCVKISAITHTTMFNKIMFNISHFPPRSVQLSTITIIYDSVIICHKQIFHSWYMLNGIEFIFSQPSTLSSSLLSLSTLSLT